MWDKWVHQIAHAEYSFNYGDIYHALAALGRTQDLWNKD